MIFSKKQKQSITGTKIPLKKVFTGPDGVDFHEYTNPLTMPAKRAIAAEVATRFAEMNMTKSQLTILIDAMKKAGNAGNITELFHLLMEMEFRLEYIGEENTMIELAACYFVMDGEDESDFSDVFKAKKIDYIKKFPEASDFFIQRAFELTTKFSEISAQDLVAYLKANGPANERFQQILRQLKLGGTLTKSTTQTKSFAKTK